MNPFKADVFNPENFKRPIKLSYDLIDSSNDKKVLSFIPWSEEWYKKKNSGKWDNTPDYGKFRTGYIGFQDHGSDLWFRNIKIRKL